MWLKLKVKCTNLKFMGIMQDNMCHSIRASVDALYRDGTGQISRDPHRKRLKSRREWLAKLKKSLLIVYGPISSYTCAQTLNTCYQFSTEEFGHTRFSYFRIIIIIIIIILIIFFFFFRPDIYLLTGTSCSHDFSLNVSRFHRGVHGIKRSFFHCRKSFF